MTNSFLKWLKVGGLLVTRLLFGILLLPLAFIMTAVARFLIKKPKVNKHDERNSRRKNYSVQNKRHTDEHQRHTKKNP